MKKLLSLLFLLIFLPVCILFAGTEEKPSVAEEEKEEKQAVIDEGKTYVFKYSHVDPADPLSTATSAYGPVLKQECERLSGGQLKVEIYPAGQLGDARATVEQVKEGSVETTILNPGVLASMYYEPLGVLDLPFIFRSREVADRACDVKRPFIKALVDECVEKTGIRIFSMTPFGFRNITNNVRPINSPADMKGIRIRTMEITPHIKLMEALGAKPVPIPFLELYTSLQTNVVDAQENTVKNIVAQKFYQVQDYLILDGHVMGIGAMLINEEWYQSLPLHLKEVLYEADRIASRTYYGYGQLSDALALETLKELGMEIYNPTPKEMQEFRDTALPYVKEWLEDKLGKELVNGFLEHLAQVEQELKEETIK